MTSWQFALKIHWECLRNGLLSLMFTFDHLLLLREQQLRLLTMSDDNWRQWHGSIVSPCLLRSSVSVPPLTSDHVPPCAAAATDNVTPCYQSCYPTRTHSPHNKSRLSVVHNTRPIKQNWKGGSPTTIQTHKMMDLPNLYLLYGMRETFISILQMSSEGDLGDYLQQSVLTGEATLALQFL